MNLSFQPFAPSVPRNLGLILYPPDKVFKDMRTVYHVLSVVNFQEPLHYRGLYCDMTYYPAHLDWVEMGSFHVRPLLHHF